MSLRSYLFALIGSLIILLTMTQLFLVYWIEQNLNQEVNVQARNISQQVFELAFEELDKDPEGSTKVKLISENITVDGITVITEDDAGNRQIIFNESSNEIITQNTIAKLKEILSIKKHNEEENLHLVKKEIKTIVDRIYQKNDALASDIVTQEHNVIIHSPEMVSHQWIKGLSPQSKTKQLLQNIQWVLILCGIIALIAAYMLSTQFNKPLALLSAGFKKLANGDYKHHVAEQGIQEMRYTIQHFNEMVTRLDQLTQAEQQHNEIKHLAELGEVSRGLAHSLRNPIHTIGLSIEQLNDDDLTPEYRVKLIKTVQNKIIHIDKNIKALLELTTSGLSRDENIPILAVVQDIMLEYKSCHGQPQKFEVYIPPELFIMGAESEIRSILHTLIINACESNSSNNKHSDQHRTVIIKAINDDVHLTVEVTDQGGGLDSTIEKSLFQPHISTKPEGAGMGLYIANRIISLHYNGNIHLENQCTDNGEITGCLAQANFNIWQATQEIQSVQKES
jgi:signal transduction histidine kinase